VSCGEIHSHAGTLDGIAGGAGRDDQRFGISFDRNALCWRLDERTGRARWDSLEGSLNLRQVSLKAREETA
jgi:hypothetical protein